MPTEYEYTNYHGFIVKTWRDLVYGKYHFTITNPNGEEWQYIGFPNYCDSKRAALKRAWYRIKWMREGTMGEHYQ